MRRKETKADLGDAEINSRILPLLPAIYDAATNHSCWPEAFAQIVRLLGGNSGMIFSHQATPEQQGLWVPYQCSEEAMKRYAEHYYKYDIWMQRGHELKAFWPGNVITSDDLVPRKELHASVFYREFLVPQDQHDGAWVILHDGSDPDIPIVNVAIFRSHTMPFFGEAEKALLAALYPHLREATSIGFRLGAAKQRASVLQAAVDATTPPMLLLNNEYRVIFANKRAQELLKGNDALLVVEGKLNTTVRQQAKLDALLKEERMGGSMLGIKHPSDKHNIWLLRVPMLQKDHSPPDARRPAMALMIHDPTATDKIDLGSFAKVHDLTRAEARLVGLLLEHGQLPPIAQELGLSKHTIRTQLRAICEKTGAERQTKLVKMLMSWPRVMA